MMYTIHFDILDGYTTDQLVFQWNGVEKPISIREGLQLPEFNVTTTSVGDCTAGYNTGMHYLIFELIQTQITYH